MGSEPHRIYLFGEFRLDANRRLLNRTNSGEVVELTPKALELLICLVQHAGTVLEKQTLLDSVWPHVIVEENNLTRAISALRSALGEEPKDHRYIATIPGRGYRFVANVAEVSGHGTDPQLQSRLKWKHGIVIAVALDFHHQGRWHLRVQPVRRLLPANRPSTSRPSLGEQADDHGPEMCRARGVLDQGLIDVVTGRLPKELKAQVFTDRFEVQVGVHAEIEEQGEERADGDDLDHHRARFLVVPET